MSILASNLASLSNSSTSLNNTQNTWLLPDGVVDLLSTEAVKQETLRYQLTQILLSYGYELINPPMIEYTESLLNYATEDLKRQTFKIIDQLTGRLMGVRADITPQIARIDANISQAHKVARYCYSGHVVYTLPKGLFGSRIPLQLGAEIFGAKELTADIELFEVLFKLLDSTKLTAQCHIDIGHVAIFAELCQLANLSQPVQDKFIELYANKALPELKQLCDSLAEQDIRYLQDFYVLGEASNDLARLEHLLSQEAKNQPTICQALNDLKQLITYLKTNYQASVSVDVTELKSYHYHTGIVFNVYVANESLPIVRGGRFTNPHCSDHIRHATGFSCDLTRWQNHIETQNKSLTIVPFETAKNILADKAHPDYAKLSDTIKSLRSSGQAVVIELNDKDKPQRATHRLIKQEDKWIQQII